MDKELAAAKEILMNIQNHIHDLEVHQRAVELMNVRAEVISGQIVDALDGKPVEIVRDPYFIARNTGMKSFRK